MFTECEVCQNAKAEYYFNIEEFEEIRPGGGFYICDDCADALDDGSDTIHLVARPLYCEPDDELTIN